MKVLTKFFQAFVFIIAAFSFPIANSASIEQEALTAHNQYRAMHHAPKLIWDVTLENYAKRYAAKCQFKHSSSPYGENLAAGYPTVNAAVNAWYRENEKYSYYWPGFSYKTGHFTQVVWKSTQKLGCAFVLCDGDNGRLWHYLVCEYSPHGNMNSRSYFHANVLPI